MKAGFESVPKIQQGILDSGKLKYYCWLFKQGIASLVPTGISNLFSFSSLYSYQK